MMRFTRPARAFTLIELLIVIAIIAILVAILLPALKGARESAQTVICSTRMKQIGVAFNSYAGDYKGRIWESGWNAPYRFWYAQPENPLFPLSGANRAVPGPAFEYLGNVDEIFGCPANKRKTPRMADVPNFGDPFWNTDAGRLQRELFNEFYTQRALSFDYTMVTGASGARPDSPTLVAWDTRCQNWFPQTGRTQPANASTLKVLRSLPVFVEEDLEWYNSRHPDGMWSNWDHLSNRHAGAGHMVFANGDVELMKLPRGGNPMLENQRGNFTANDLWAKGFQGRWWQVAPSWPNPGVRRYGWFDGPR